MRSSKTFKAVITSVLAVLIALALFLQGRTVSQAGVVINEVLVSNAFPALDDDRHSTDWVELVNIGSRPLNLGGFGLSDDVGQPKKWVFPDFPGYDPGSRSDPTGLVLGKSKNRFAQPAPVSPAKNAENLYASFDPHLVSRHARWRTLSATPLDEPPPRWKLRAFDDSDLEDMGAGSRFSPRSQSQLRPRCFRPGVLSPRFPRRAANVASMSRVDIPWTYIRAISSSSFSVRLT